MRVTINDRPADWLTDGQEKDVRLASTWAVIEGSVLDSSVAAAKVLFRWRIVCVCFVAFVWLVLFVMAALARPDDRTFMGNLALVLAVLTPLALWLAYWIKRERLYASLPERTRASPATGTSVRVDGSGVTIGSRSAAWNEVAIDGVDLARVTGAHGYRAYYVKRLHLRLNEVPFVLDKSLLDEGVAIVDEIYRRKLR